MQPTVYLLVIRGSEGKHILCLIFHSLSGWIHSFSKKAYGDNKRIMGEARKQERERESEGERERERSVVICVSCVAMLSSNFPPFL